MKKYIRTLYLTAITAIIMTAAVMLAGCGGSSVRTIPVPSGGWTGKELMSVTYIAGNSLSSPPVYGDFKSKTKIKEDLTVEGKNFVKKFVYYGNDILVDITYSCSCKNSDITDTSPIDGMYMEREFSKADSQIVINGIKMGSSKESVIAALGEPDEWRMKETVADYKFKDGGFMTLDFEAGMLFSISIHGLAD